MERREDVGAASRSGADLYLAHALPLTVTVGFAQGLVRAKARARYFRAGLAF